MKLLGIIGGVSWTSTADHDRLLNDQAGRPAFSAAAELLHVQAALDWMLG